jgi:Fe-S cluster assembly ATPase SufC
MQLVNFTYACFYVAMSRVRKRQHLQILLKHEDNEVQEWMTLLYIHALLRDKSIHAFFSGFEKDRSNWINDAWNPNLAADTTL